MNNQESWEETIGHTPDRDMRDKTRIMLSKTEKEKQAIILENRRYNEMYYKLSKEKQKELKLKVLEIAKTRPYGDLKLTQKAILIELLEGR